MGFADAMMNVLSLGAHNRVKKRVVEYEGLQQQVERAHNALEQRKVLVNQTLEALIGTKTAGLKSLKKLSKISDNLYVRDRQPREQTFDRVTIDVPLSTIQDTLSAADIAMNGAKGAGVGISTALGTWALVGTFGTASTGSAIVSLSGAAATNATLAWLGGGSLATGGLGMVGGTAVLGGIVFFPVVVIMGVFSHLSAGKKINKIEEANMEALAAINRYKELSLGLDAMDRRANELRRSVVKAADTFEFELAMTYKALYALGFLSRAFRSLRRLFGGKYFSESDLKRISLLLQMAASLAELIDVRIMDETGKVI